MFQLEAAPSAPGRNQAPEFAGAILERGPRIERDRRSAVIGVEELPAVLELKFEVLRRLLRVTHHDGELASQTKDRENECKSAQP